MERERRADKRKNSDERHFEKLVRKQEDYEVRRKKDRDYEVEKVESRLRRKKRLIEEDQDAEMVQNEKRRRKRNPRGYLDDKLNRKKER